MKEAEETEEGVLVKEVEVQRNRINKRNRSKGNRGSITSESSKGSIRNESSRRNRRRSVSKRSTRSIRS